MLVHSHWDSPVLSPLSYNSQTTISTSQSSLYCMNGTESFSHACQYVCAVPFRSRPEILLLHHYYNNYTSGLYNANALLILPDIENKR